MTKKAMRFTGWQEDLCGDGPAIELWTPLATGSTKSRKSLEDAGVYVPDGHNYNPGEIFEPL